MKLIFIDYYIDALMGGWPGMGPRLVCPGTEIKPRMHKLLEKKVDNSNWAGHPEKYINLLKTEIERLRQHFNDIPPNVKGIRNNRGSI
jgi:hypothetical protein